MQTSGQHVNCFTLSVVTPGAYAAAYAGTITKVKTVNNPSNTNVNTNNTSCDFVMPVPTPVSIDWNGNFSILIYIAIF